MGRAKIKSRSGDDQPRPPLGEEERKRKNRKPGDGLSDDSPAHMGLTVRKPMRYLDGDKLGPGAEQLRKRGEQAQLKRGGVEHESERREILFAGSLGGGLKDAVAQSEPPSRLLRGGGAGRIG